jgi:hypothetical protein
MVVDRIVLSINLAILLKAKNYSLALSIHASLRELKTLRSSNFLEEVPCSSSKIRALPPEMRGYLCSEASRVAKMIDQCLIVLLLK